MRTTARVGWAAAIVVALAGTGLTVAAANGFGFTPAAQADDLEPAATEPITKQELIAKEEQPGRVGNVEERTLQSNGGVVTWLPVEGAVIERGAPLFRVDESPTVLLYGSLPAYRPLTVGTTGPDVRQFEENLAALGYTGFTVDNDYTAATARAVQAWEKSLGVAKTGVVEPGRVHYAPAALQVVDLIGSVGDGGGGDLLTVARRERIVIVDLDAGDARYAVVGTAVGVTLPDGTSTTGKVTAVESIVSPGKPDGSTEETTMLRVTVTPDDAAALPATGASTAKVAFTAESREDVLTVPVSALLALAEGGYGVEVVDGGDHELVAVETGLFAQGRVEISGEGIAEGDHVVVPE
ncbi:MAG: peptidoglycan-binding protein [Actinomycetota bacterium]|nr:peptidoglycan-binding protein [Actinomycetota bacterium]